MRPALIVTSHGNMAEETVNSAKMIVGDIDNIHIISMMADDGLSKTTEKFSIVLNQLDKTSQIVVLADLKGGTPCNVAMMKMSDYPNMQVITGFNLAMLLESIFTQATTSIELVEQLLDAGKSAINIIELPTLMSSDDDDDDDIELD